MLKARGDGRVGNVWTEGLRTYLREKTHLRFLKREFHYFFCEMIYNWTLKMQMRERMGLV